MDAIIIRLLGAALLCMTAATMTARADVTVQESLVVNGGGLMSFANMSGKTTTQIAGKRARTDQDVKMQSRVVRLFAGGPTAEITRLDDDQVFELNLKKKQYVATSLAERRAQLEKSTREMSESQESKQKEAAPVDESDCDWSPAKSDVQKNGEKASIAGFDAERLTITVSQSCKSRKTGAVCEYALALDQWLADKVDGMSEVQDFYKAYADKMGLGSNASPGFAQNSQALFASYKDLWAEVAKKSGSVKGRPLRSTFALAIGGAQCGAQTGGSGSAGTPTAEAMAAASQIGDAIGGLFGSKKKAAPAATAPLLVNGMTPLMTVSTELVSISRENLAAAVFEPPADFKKVEP